MKKLFCCLIAMVFIIMTITFVINIPSTTFGRYMTSSKSNLNFEIVASPGIYISNSFNQSLSDIKWTVIKPYEDSGDLDDDSGPVDELSADMVQVYAFAPESLPAPTEDATTAPTEEATTAPTEEATTTPTEEATTAPTEEATTAPTEETTIAPTEEATTAPTEEATTAPTEETTTAPTEEATTAPTEETTTAPTEEATTAPTEETTTAPIEEATTAPTEEATTVPTEEMTTAPTEEATTAPTEEATTAPTEEATTAPTEEATTAPTEEATTDSTEDATTAPTEEATTDSIEEPLTEDLTEIQLYNSLGITSGQGIRFHISNVDTSAVLAQIDNISPDDMHFRIRLLVPDDIWTGVTESAQSTESLTDIDEEGTEATTEQGFSAMALGVQLRVSSNGEDYSNPINASYIYLSEYTSVSMNNPDTPYWAFTFCTNDAENYYTLTGGQPSLIHFMITINDSTIDTSRFIIMVEQYHIYE